MYCSDRYGFIWTADCCIRQFPGHSGSAWNPHVSGTAYRFLYGNGKRIWCMYLCPGNGIFGLLARLSPIYYKVDREKWEQYSGQQERLDCPTLINVRQMQGMSGCHACGRCLGHRNAVELGFRSPSSEIVTTPENRISGSELFLLLGCDRDLYSGTGVAWKRSLQPVHSSTCTAGRFGSQRFALVAVCQSIESVSPDFHHHQRLGTGTDDSRPASSGCSCLRQWHPVETIGALPDSCHWFRYFSGYQPDRFFTLGSLWISFRVETGISIHGPDRCVPVFGLAGHQDNFWPHSSCQHDRVFYLLLVSGLAFRRLDELFPDIKKPAPKAGFLNGLRINPVPARCFPAAGTCPIHRHFPEIPV